ncbi:MAG TPA: hypothetical protein DHV60_06095 [Verrucomicrobiales bacterium]|nr:hypothetical protein [Verrucomicrobiales bacterium]
MSFLKPRRKTTRSPRVVGKGGDLQKLHIRVTSPRIVMIEVVRGLYRSAKIIMMLVLIGMIAWGGYLGIRHIFIDNEEYRLQEIKLETNGHINHARIVEVTGIDLDASIFAIDTDHIRKCLLSLPEVTRCDVERRLPGTLKITVDERLPVAWLQSAHYGFLGKVEGGVLADEDGVTFPCEGSLWETSRDLPVVMVNVAAMGTFHHGKKLKHPEVIRALHLIKVLTASNLRADWKPQEIMILNEYSLEVTSHDGSRAVFGMYDHERQITDFISIREHALKTLRAVEHINLIPKKNIPVKFAGAPILVPPQKKQTFPSLNDRDIKSIIDRN